MAKKKADTAKVEQEKMRAAIALALISAPSPYIWWERTMSIDILVEEVRVFLGLQQSFAKRVLKALKQAIAEWLPAGWLTYDTNKKCISLKKDAEPMFVTMAESVC
jgi:hypothetical protein